MAANQPPWPREWLMTDERFDDRLWETIDRLPEGAGLVFRHYSLNEAERWSLGRRVAEAARQRSLVLAVAGCGRLAEELEAKLVHNPDAPSELPISMAVHDQRQAENARRAGAVLAFIAPIHRTRSHPGVRYLGTAKAAQLAQIAGCPAIALGGMDAASFAQLEASFPGVFHGYAGIDCWLGDRPRT
jgi:thiamine-phosphate pyrophosphorylase